MGDIFYTVHDECSEVLIEKKSKFIATLRHCENEAECNEFIRSIKKKYHDAKHNVYAYILKDSVDFKKCSDDGEPSQTAGAPVLKILDEQSLKNIAVVVTRYFGGVLLGTGGLIRAYSGATKKVIESSKIFKCESFKTINLQTEYDLAKKIKNICVTNDYFINDVSYAEKVTFKIFIKVDEFPRAQKILLELLYSQELVADEIFYGTICDGKFFYA